MLKKYIKDISIPVNKILFENYSALNLNESSLIILIRLMEYSKRSSTLPDMDVLQKGTTLSKNDISRIIQSLIESDLMTLETSKVNDKYMDVVSFEPLYTQLIALTEDDKAERKPNPEDIRGLFSYVENLYGRTLNPNEFERMNSWLNESKFSARKIEEAVDIAYRNQVTSLAYVERVLHNMLKSPEPDNNHTSRPPFKNWLKGE